MGLIFTTELRKNNELQFLDLKLVLHREHICWCSHQRSAKPVLDYMSGHFKLVKRGIVKSCLMSALQKSCGHLIGVVTQRRRRTALVGKRGNEKEEE